MTHIHSRTFFYSEVDGGEKTRSIVIPHTGFLEAIDRHLKGLPTSNGSFNKVRAIIGCPIAYCIQSIEDAHASRSFKSDKLLGIFHAIKGADDRFRPENLKPAIDFLHDNACLIGEGIVSDVRIPKVNAQLEIAEKFIDILLHLTLTVHTLEDTENIVTNLLDSYACYLEKFFQFGQPENDLSQSQLNASKNLMRVCSKLKIEIPDYFKDVRLKILNGFAKQAFDIVSNPDPKAGWDIYHLVSELGNAYFKLDLKPDDPIACVRDSGSTLLKARYHGGQLVYLFHSEHFSISARTVEELLQRASGVHAKSSTSPVAHINSLLEMMPE